MTKLADLEDEILRHPDPVVSVPELAERMDRSTTHISDKMEKLEYMDRVERKQVGANAYAWWHVDRTKPRQLPPEEHPDQSALEDVGPAHDPHSGERRDVDDVEEAGNDLRDQMETALVDLDVPGRDPAVERTRRQAITYAWDRLRDEGSMRSRDIASDVLGQFWDDPDLQYSTASGRYAGYQLWDNCVRDVLRELPGVHTGNPEWSFHEPGENE